MSQRLLHCNATERPEHDCATRDNATWKTQLYTCMLWLSFECTHLNVKILNSNADAMHLIVIEHY